MKKTQTLFIIMVIFMACKNQNPKELFGRTIAYTYGADVYHLTIDTDSTLHWQAMSGAEKGHSGKEQYTADWLNKNQLFITWYEVTGVGVSQILDFEEGKVYNHLLTGGKARKVYGQIKIID